MKITKARLLLVTGLSLNLVTFPAIVHGSDKNPVTSGSDRYSLALKWKTDAVFRTPESAVYYPAGGYLFISNVNGAPTARDNNGFISKLSLTGEVIELEWVSGFDAPKGMAVLDGKLYVADIDRLVVVDIAKSEIVDSYPVAEARFLNDVETDGNGNVIFTDTVLNTVFKFRDGKVTPFIELDGYQSPNGLLHAGNLLMGTAGHILVVSDRGELTLLLAPDKGGIDGLKQVDERTYLISDWTGNAYVASIGEGDAYKVLEKPGDDENIADFELVKTSENLLIVPTFFGNTVEAYCVKR